MNTKVDIVRGLEYYHFSNVFKPTEVVKMMLSIEVLDEQLKHVLVEELIHGNRIIGFSLGSPSEEAISIVIEHPFYKRYDSEFDVEYHYLNDPHEGGQKYTSPSTDHELVSAYR